MTIYAVRWTWNNRNWSSSYSTDYHAEQFANALRGNGIPRVAVVQTTNREIQYRRTIRCWIFNANRKLLLGY